MLSEKEIRELVESVVKELDLTGIKGNAANPVPEVVAEEPDEGDILPDLGALDLSKWSEIPNPEDPEGLARIKSTTPARIGVWRAGNRFKVNPWLRFRIDLAAAKDAVLQEVAPELIEKLGLFTVQTVVQDKDEYLTRPDLGRKLSDEAKKILAEKCEKSPDVQLVVADGLSSTAIEANALDFIPAFEEAIKNYGLKMGTTFFVKYGRVALMDDIGELLDPEVLVILVGERPGLVTAKSMSAYMCYKPNKNTIESDRTLVSNIHDGGLPPVEAGAHVASIVKKIFDAKASGLKLNE
jgi:ethanolamine ammonia-lyase small subunit